MRRVLLAAIAFAVLAIAAPVAAAGWSVSVDEPTAGGEGYAVVRGDVVVRASVSGGVGEARFAAYHARPSGGSWAEASSVAMARVGDGRFAAEDAPLATAELPNGVYDLEVRVWGEVPEYRPNNPSTFSARVLQLRVDNPPAPPRKPSAGVAIGSYRAAWRAPAGADRPDFVGYRVLIRQGACPDDPSAYAVAGETAETSLFAGTEPGRHCVRIQSLRSSPVSEVVASGLSAPLRIRVPGSSVPGAYARGAIPPEPPPAPPALGEGELIVSDRPFGEDLPYGSRTVLEAVGDEGERAALRDAELGPDPRQTPLVLTAGVLLVLTALHLRRFLRRGAGRPRGAGAGRG